MTGGLEREKVSGLAQQTHAASEGESTASQGPADGIGSPTGAGGTPSPAPDEIQAMFEASIAEADAEAEAPPPVTEAPAVLAELVVDEAALQPEALAQTARLALAQLEALDGQLRQPANDERALAARLDRAGAMMTRASEVIDAFPKEDATFDIVRDELLDRYFGVQRRIEELRKKPDTPEQPMARPKRRTATTEIARRKRRTATTEIARQKRRTATTEIARQKRRTTMLVSRPSAEEGERRRKRRLVVMVVLVGLVAAGRIALLVVDSKAQVPAAVKQDKDALGKAAQLRGGVDPSEALGQGKPVIVRVRLVQLPDGSLSASAAAIDGDGDRPKLTFTWYKNDKQLKTGIDKNVPAAEVETAASYAVEVIASDGNNVTLPMRTEPLIAKAPPAAKQSDRK